MGEQNGKRFTTDMERQQNKNTALAGLNPKDF
jgi:hypothetical protein